MKNQNIIPDGANLNNVEPVGTYFGKNVAEMHWPEETILPFTKFDENGKKILQHFVLPNGQTINI